MPHRPVNPEFCLENGAGGQAKFCTPRRNPSPEASVKGTFPLPKIYRTNYSGEASTDKRLK